ncbi:MAG: hypothetical protein ACOZAO_01555 [Patescibacteria group bacterium]
MFKTTVYKIFAYILFFLTSVTVVFAQETNPFSNIINSPEKPLYKQDYIFDETNDSKKNFYKSFDLFPVADFMSLRDSYVQFLELNCEGTIDRCDPTNAVVLARTKELLTKKVDAFDSYFVVIISNVSKNENLAPDDQELLITLMKSYTDRLDRLKTSVNSTNNITVLRDLSTQIDQQITLSLDIIKGTAGDAYIKKGKTYIITYSSLLDTLNSHVNSAIKVGNNMDASSSNLNTAGELLQEASKDFDSADQLLTAANKSSDPLGAANTAYADFSSGLMKLRRVRNLLNLVILDLDTAYEKNSWKLEVQE